MVLRSRVWLIGVLILGISLCSSVSFLARSARAQTTEDVAAETEPPAQVEVEPVADDQQIQRRLDRILAATGWFESHDVKVDEGVVFLRGRTDRVEHKEWATKLAQNTRDVVAVANSMEIARPSVSNFAPAWEELNDLQRSFIQSLPLVLVALGVILLAWIASKIFAAVSRRVSKRRTDSPLLQEIVAKAVAIPVILVGLYLALRITGLTRLAATVLGGTGLLGLILGIAFRDIAENYLASVLLSLKRPFRAGDLILVEGRKGIVQSVSTRGTTMMTLEGNHVQIPNSTIYKSIVENFTANPNTRIDFLIGVDYDCSIAKAQNVIFELLTAHPAILHDPEPLVLVDELAASTVNLHIFAWVNAHQHSLPKVRSSVIRQAKLALQEAGITMPDEAREVIFPKGISVTTVDATPTARTEALQASVDEQDGDREVATSPEGGLSSEAPELAEQAAKSRKLDSGTDLLNSPQSAGSP